MLRRRPRTCSTFPPKGKAKNSCGPGKSGFSKDKEYQERSSILWIVPSNHLEINSGSVIAASSSNQVALKHWPYKQGKTNGTTSQLRSLKTDSQLEFHSELQLHFSLLDISSIRSIALPPERLSSVRRQPFS